jgi:thioredoxin-dependent peroxiredoxin
MIGRGDPAPMFELDGIDGRTFESVTYSLSQCSGRPTVLVFYPADNSPICTLQLRAYTDDFTAFEALDAQVLAISPQSVQTHAEFARSNGGFAFPLLSDLDRRVGERYGVLGPVGFYRRSVVVIDAHGIVRWAHRATAGLTFRPVAELVAVVASISAD